MLIDTPQCEMGRAVPHFRLCDAGGQEHHFEGLMGEKGLVVAFICNHCPYVKAIIDRLVADAATLAAEGVNTVAIMSNDYASYPDDSPSKMVEFAQQHGFGFPYLVDDSQEVARQYGAVCTPDFFGVNARGELQYRARLDDAKMGDAGNRKAELLEGMRLVARTGAGPAKQMPSMGCSIKWR